MYTTSTAFLEALTEAGISYIFANFGSDHPGIIEGMAEAHAMGRKVPQIVTCPNEMVALSIADGYARITGQAQCVLIHVECGTQALAGAVHNMAKARIPALIVAGASPFTQEGESKGSRNEFIQWIQDVFDQRGLVRGYVKYDNEIRTGKNIKQIIHRALQFAHSDPKGGVYLMVAREVLEEEIPKIDVPPEQFQPISPAALPNDGIAAITDALLRAKTPLVVTSYVGRKTEAAIELKKLTDRLGIGVLESVPSYMNFPHTDPMYQGNAWNEQVQNAVLGGADVVLVLDSDIPWIPIVSQPPKSATIFHIDTDPLKQQMPLWYIPAKQVFRADCATALAQINAALDSKQIPAAQVSERKAHYTKLHDARAKRLADLEERKDVITGEILTAAIRHKIDSDTIVLNEGITNYHTIFNHMQMTRPGHMFTSGAGSLGWHGGAAIGMKMANPDKTVVALAGDGCYMFSVPSSVHWISRQYDAPFLTVVYNNRGWRAPKLAMLNIHPAGHASRANELGVSFDPPADYSAIAAAAGGAFALKVEKLSELDAAIDAALKAVRVEKRSAVLDVWLPHL